MRSSKKVIMKLDCVIIENIFVKNYSEKRWKTY